MRRTWIATGAILAAGLSSAGEAGAQAWLTDRALTEGRGIRVGDFELHPGAGVEVGYDSNVFGQPSSSTPPPAGEPGVVGAFRLRGTAHLALSTLGPQRSATTLGVMQTPPTVNFHALAAIVGNGYLDAGTPLNANGGTNPSGVGGTLGFNVEVFPQRTWQFLAYDTFLRTTQGGNDYGFTLGVYTHDDNTGGVGLVFSPNRGEVLDMRLTYENRLSFYEDARFQNYSSDANEVGFRSRWRFLPKTAILFEAFVTPTFYLTTPMIAGTNGLFGSYPIRARAGLNGLLTERVGLLLMGGYEGTYFAAGDNASTFIGQAELRYIFSPLAAFHVGFIRDIAPSIVGNYMIRNNAYVSINQSFGGVFYLLGEVNAGYLQYGFAADQNGVQDPAIVMGGTDSNGRWSAWRIQGRIFGEYRFSDVFGINATLSASSNITDARINEMPLISAAWTKFEAFLGARVNW